jgi:hypothetical protein
MAAKVNEIRNRKVDKKGAGGKKGRSKVALSGVKCG